MNSTITLPKTNKYNYERNWNLKEIWHASKNLKIHQIDPKKLWQNRYSKVFCWLEKDESINNEIFLEHFERVLNADLNYPIILSEEQYIMDGVHRLMKAIHLGYEKIPYVQFDKDPISEELK